MSDLNEPLEISIKGDNNNSNLILNSQQSLIGDAATKKEQSNIDYLKNYFKEVNYDTEKIKQLIYDAPDFDSALKLLEDVATILKDATTSLKITHYNTPVLGTKYIRGIGYIDFKAIPEGENTDLDSTEAQGIRSSFGGIYNGTREYFGIFEETSVFSVLLQNDNASSTMLVYITINNKGRIIKVDFNDVKQQIFYKDEPIPNGGIPMSKLPEKIRSRLMTHPAGSLPDPLTTQGAIVILGGPYIGSALNLIYQINDAFLFADPFLTNIENVENYNDVIVDENIIKTGIGFPGGPSFAPPLESTLNIEDFKKLLYVLRVIFKYDEIEW